MTLRSRRYRIYYKGKYLATIDRVDNAQDPKQVFTLDYVGDANADDGHVSLFSRLRRQEIFVCSLKEYRETSGIYHNFESTLKIIQDIGPLCYD